MQSCERDSVEGLANFCPLLDYLAEIKSPRTFLLVDVGCSGGIDRQWRRLRGRLRAIGFDPDVREIERLRAREKNPNVSYENVFAGLPPDHPFARQRHDRLELERNPWPRLSTARYLELVYPSERETADKEKRSANLWQAAQLADRASPVFLPEYLLGKGITSLDFLKIDVDGADFDILNSFDHALEELQVLGVGIEVRFWGSEGGTDGTFHNVDRFLKARGFELFNLTIRRYSMTALPSRFQARAPGATEFGRVHQGDAMYARDLGSGLYREFADSLSADKILNLAAIFAIFDLPDCAAELLVEFRHRLSSCCTVDRALDALATQARGRPAGYRRHLQRFVEHPRTFLGTKNPLLTISRAWMKGYRKWRGRMELLRLERS